jgi:hypothetical protein
MITCLKCDKSASTIPWTERSMVNVSGRRDHRGVKPLCYIYSISCNTC